MTGELQVFQKGCKITLIEYGNLGSSPVNWGKLKRDIAACKPLGAIRTLVKH